MKIINAVRLAPAFAAFGVATLLVSPLLQSAAKAQAPGGGGGGGNRGGNRRAPFAFGTVSAVDTGAGTITVTSPFGGGTQTIQTQGTTQIVSQVAAQVSELKVGDKVQVQGIPTGITASALSIGDSPFANMGGNGGAPPPPAGNGGGAPPPPAAAPQSFAMATGTVTSTNPLTVKVSDSVSLTLKMDPTAKVTKYTPVNLSAIKVGDQIVGLGQTGADGSLAATTVAVNVNMGGMGGGFGGGRGGFGGGGFGGGGRGRRGGGNGGQGGFGGGNGGQGGGGNGGGFGGGNGGAAQGNMTQ